jgi:hypothetical protein
MTIHQLAINIGARPEMKSLADVLAEMQKYIPEMNREVLVASINEATSGYAAARTELQKKLDGLKREARNDVKLRGAIGELQGYLGRGELPSKSPRRPAEPSEEIAELRARAEGLQTALRNSDPALRKKYEAQIVNLTDRLENGAFTLPEPKEPPQVSKEIERLIYERDMLKKQIRQRVESLKPPTVWGRVAEPLNAARAIMTSMDVSAPLRQGGIVMLSNPARGAKAIIPMLRAFASDEYAFKVNQEISNRPNAPLYARSKLYLSGDASPVNAQEEKFISKIAGRVPLVKGSERAYSTFLNKVRADTFDAMLNGLADGEATPEATAAIARYVNTATGRVNLPGEFENAANALNTVFFAPRWAASRFAFLGGQPMYGGTAASRKLIAKEYAKFMIGAGVVASLGVAAGATIETDPRSSDFGKLRIGKTRMDMMAGLPQAATFTARMATGQTKDQRGRVVDLEKQNSSRAGVAARFLRGKLAPLPAAAANLMAGENIVGEETTPAKEAVRLVTPMSFNDIIEAMEAQGVERGTAIAILSLFGASTTTYDQKK